MLDHVVKAQMVQKLCLYACIRQAKDRRIRLEEGARMRLKGQNRCRDTIGLGKVHLKQIIRADPNQNNEHTGFTDYDNDGDLDGFQANFSGTNWIFQSGLAQGSYVGGIDL